jgi:hypothetical protein
MVTPGGLDGEHQLAAGQANPPDLYATRITGSREALTEVLRQFELDAGCRPHPELNSDGGGSLIVYASDAAIRELQAAGYAVERGENVSALGRERQSEVGQGDRFEGGRVVPRGLGQKPRRDGQGGERS